MLGWKVISCRKGIVNDNKQGGVASEAEEEQIRARRRLREEQDAEFQVALLQDQV